MKYIKRLFTFFLLSSIAGVIAIAAIYFYIRPELPSVDVLKDVRLQTPMKIYSHDGKLISQFGVKRRIPLTLEQIPKQLIQALIATEDSRFYEHPGIDPIGIMRAAINLAITGEKQQGASTLTMQMARDFFLTRDKTYIRKIKEVFIAWHMERLLTKDEILELYLNKVELGHRAFGVGAAARVYYGKDIQELSLAQIATIVGLPKAPSTLNPISRPDRAFARRRVVLLRMLDEGYISRDEFDAAAIEPVTAKKHGAEIELNAPYLADLIYREMIELYGKEEAETGGYNVYATAPSHLQSAAQEAVLRNLHDYDERHGFRGPLRQLWQHVEYDGTENTDLLTSSFDDPSWDQDKMTEFLNDYPSYAPLVPAIVVSVTEKHIQVFNKNQQYVDIEWDGLVWARPFIDDNTQGPVPKTASEIVTEGALIWTRKEPETDLWQLSQFPDVSGSFVALDPTTGAAQAIVGGYSFEQSQFNRATQAKRQVGSNIKPFIYSSALDNGYTVASIINDAPINKWERGSGTVWRPENSPKVYDGPIRIRKALGRSKNVVSIRLLRGVGLDDVIEYLTNFGFEKSELNRDETLALGSASFTPLEVVRGFATFANGGFLIEPYFIDRIEGQFGDFSWQANPAVACPQCEHSDNESSAADEILDNLTDESEQNSLLPTHLAPRVITSQNAFLMSDIMRTAVRFNGNSRKKTMWQGTGWRARRILQRDDLAGKTGTTNDAKDTWFSGFAPGLVASSWVGFDNMERSLGRTSRHQELINKNPERFNYIGNAMIGGEDGSHAAQPAWIRFMQKALEGVPQQDRNIPSGIVTARIDRVSGKLTKRTDHTSRFEYFVRGSEPDTYVEENELVDPFENDKPVEIEEDIF